jgi:hypothetical protein
MTFQDEINGELRRNYPYSYYESSKIKKDNSQRRPNSIIKENTDNIIEKTEIMNSVICKFNINEIENILIKKNDNINKNNILIKK